MVNEAWNNAPEELKCLFIDPATAAKKEYDLSRSASPENFSNAADTQKKNVIDFEGDLSTKSVKDLDEGNPCTELKNVTNVELVLGKVKNADQDHDGEIVENDVSKECIEDYELQLAAVLERSNQIKRRNDAMIQKLY